jgi:hypothetical protein
MSKAICMEKHRKFGKNRSLFGVSGRVMAVDDVA